MSQPDPYGLQPSPADGIPAGQLPPVGYEAIDPVTGQPMSSAQPADGYLGYATGGQPPQGQLPAGYPALQPGYPAPQPGYPPAPGYPVQGQVPMYPPGYVAAGQVPAGYPAQPQYPAPYPGYPAPGYGYPLVPVGPKRPGSVTAAAVLAFIQGGLALIGGITTMTGASAFYGVSRYSSSYSDIGTEFTMVGIAMLVAGGLLIAGGATVLSRKPGVLVAGCALSILVSGYLVVRLLNITYASVGIWLPIIYAILPIIALALAMGTDAKTWARRNG